VSRIGDNGGPPPVPFTAKTKVECVKQLLERGDLTAAQKCIGAMMIVQADREWSAEMKTAELQQAASAKDRETVFRATKTLDEKGIISKSSGRGQSGKYVVLPPKIIEAVVEAYEDAKSSRVKADQLETKWSGETGRHNQSASPPKVVGSVPTGRVNPVGFEPTTSQASLAPAHAEVNNNIYNNYNNLSKKTSSNISEQGSPRETLDRLESQLLDACNGALADPVNCMGLASLAIPQMWINSGCDLELDILPTLRAIGKVKHGENINSWHYFTKPIAQARKRREAGMPTVNAPAAKEGKAEKLKRLFQAVSDEKGGG